MAPEHIDWNHVPTNLAHGVTEKVGKKGVQRLQGQGDFLFEVAPDDTVARVEPASNVEETVIADARKAKSPWHLVHGLSTTRHAQGRKKGAEAAYGNRTLDNAGINSEKRKVRKNRRRVQAEEFKRARRSNTHG